jgi:serine/threonine protein kinase
VDEHVPPVAAPVVPGLTGLTVLARGGYATVYRALQESVGRDVAVKIENRSLDTEHDRRRFMREARAAGRMSSHPHVVDLFDAGVLPDGHPYMIMELCEGSYADRLRAERLAPAEVRDVGAKIADALADAHRLGVLHRDVKPANILVSGFGEPALADFGLAVLTEMRDVSMTLEVLTPAYAPREMFRHGCEPSPAADVYSLCATLYALLRGKPPRWYEDRDPSLITLIELFDRPIPDLPGVPADLLDLLRAGMSNDAGGRPTAEELRDGLGSLPLQPAPVPADDAVRVTPAPASRPRAWSMLTQPRPADPPVPPPPASPADRPAPPGEAPPDPEATVPHQRDRWPFIGAGVAILVLGLVVAAAAWYGSGRPVASRVVLRSGASPVSRSTGQVGIGGCMLSALGAVCPTAPQCFDTLTVSAGVASARALPCTQPHTWEVFAIGVLPPGLPDVAYQEVKADQAVGRICNAGVLVLVDIAARSWLVDVLPPSPEAFAGGDRTFKCLAGTGPNRQSAPAFSR